MVTNRAGQVHYHMQNDAQRLDCDSNDRKQMYSTSFKNKPDLYSRSHPYGRVVARQMKKRRRLYRLKLYKASELGSHGDHQLKPSALAPKTSISAARNGSFQTLPDAIQNTIVSHLDYQSRIFLSQVNHHFHQMARPEEANPRDKFQFVMRAEREFKQHFPDRDSLGNFACYFCYRVLQADSFRKDQAQEAFVMNIEPENAVKYTKIQLRRYCETCGCKHGFDRRVSRTA